MSTLDLGKIKLVWRGPYDNSTAYTPDDVVSSGGSSYICILASTGNAVSNGTYWQQMAGKGTDADLLNISGTVQGDIYYNNGSAIARLAPGSASQVLQSGGSGANPSWGTVSSDFVKIASGTHTSANYMNIDNCFTADYNIYKLYVYDITTSGDAAYMRAQLRSGGASGVTSTASEYRFVTRMWYRNSSTSGSTGEHAWNDSSFRIGWQGTVSNGQKPQTIEMFLNNPYSNTTKFMATGLHGHLRDSDVGFANFALTNDSTNSIRWTGMTFWTNNITAWSGKYAVYGMKT